MPKDIKAVCGIKPTTFACPVKCLNQNKVQISDEMFMLGSLGYTFDSVTYCKILHNFIQTANFIWFKLRIVTHTFFRMVLTKNVLTPGQFCNVKPQPGLFFYLFIFNKMSWCHMTGIASHLKICIDFKSKIVCTCVIVGETWTVSYEHCFKNSVSGVCFDKI